MKTSEDYESSVHLTAIRRALARRNAAVMVGAGFSRNAEGGERLSTWSQLSTELLRRLDPDADASAFSIGNVTQLGEQFSRVFSEPALEDFLKEMVPDDRVRPGTLHDDLLRLEWSEIFTTNYDTLIERAAAKMFERDHFTVCCREDIPQSKILGTRRIVKLHGSFPSQRPFIFTEEHYRTYPEKFAPFVNLVRQSLLENVFCLIGFSGDDPNFLHWLGWVRDMLDGASLPVYLFLDKVPAFGLRKLLEARGVTPVVLPQPSGTESQNYADRYRQLLMALAIPLEEPAIEWGSINFPGKRSSAEEKLDERYCRWMSDLQQIASLRNNYPGWMVAPASVRQRFKSSLIQFNQSIENKWLRDKVNLENVTIRIIILSLYAWQQEILLAPLDDSVVLYAIDILESVQLEALEDATAEVKEKARNLSVVRSSEVKAHAQYLAISMLRWARQGLRDKEFEYLSFYLERHAGAFSSDVINNEKILFSLQRGQRTRARNSLLSWKVISADPYMLVRHAVFTAELGEVELGIAACNIAIQKIRASQKIKPNDPLLVSQEAWACLLADRLQQGHNIWHSTGKNSDEPVVENLSERLQALAARGYSPQRELEQAEAALGAEAVASFKSDLKSNSFNLGKSSSTRRWGLTSEFQAKKTAAFEWLELAERTGLLPRMPGVQFHSWSYLQAAWWIQYNDSMARVHGILMRTLSLAALKPRDSSVPSHKSGWLSRFQVALFSNEEAEATCARLIQEVEDTVRINNEYSDTRLSIEFPLEVFSRLVVRIENSSSVLNLGLRVIDLFGNINLKFGENYQTMLSTALSRCCESLELESFLILLQAAAELPVPDAKMYVQNRWVRLSEIVNESKFSVTTEAKNNNWIAIRCKSLQSIKLNPSAYSWSLLITLKLLGVLNVDDDEEVSKILWQESEKWPTSEFLHASAAFYWPAPLSKQQNLEKALVEFLISCRIGNLNFEIDDFLGGSLQGQPNDLFFELFLLGLSRNVLNLECCLLLLRKIMNWWQEEEEKILILMPSVEHLKKVSMVRIDLIDAIVYKCMLLHCAGNLNAVVEHDFQSTISSFMSVFSRFKDSMKRVCVLDSFSRRDFVDFDRHQWEIGNVFLIRDEVQIHIASSVVQSLVEDLPLLGKSGLDILFDGVCAVAMARGLPGSLKAMEMLAQTAYLRPSLFSVRHWESCEKALALFDEELVYTPIRDSFLIGDDSIPNFRFACARLAGVLWSSRSHINDSPIVNKWLKIAEADPLPEMRLKKYRLLGRSAH